MKISCSSQIAPGDTFLEKFANLVKYGFQGMEIRLLVEDNLPEMVSKIQQASKQTGIIPSSLLVPSPAFRRPLVDQEALKAKIAHIKMATSVSGQLGCPTLLCPEYGYQDPLPLFSNPKRYSSYERDLFIQLLEAAETSARENGTIVLLEPINRYETHFNHRLEHAVELIKTTAATRIRILADFFHMNIEEADPIAAILGADSYIGHVHLSDNNRLLPGKGNINFTSLFSALKQVKYDNFLALECIIPDDVNKELPECAQFLMKCIADA